MKSNERTVEIVETEATPKSSRPDLDKRHLLFLEIEIEKEALSHWR